jgi:DNA replication protein DnaC
MTTTNTVDAARVELLLSELRLPGIKLMWAKLAEQSDKEGWPAARFLTTLAEHEMAERGRRRIERHLAEARLPAGKTLATFDFEAEAAARAPTKGIETPAQKLDHAFGASGAVGSIEVRDSPPQESHDH